MKLAIGLFALLLASTTLLPAQSINIDLGPPGATRPPDGYRGAGLPGRWNKFDALAPGVHFPLFGLAGALTPATLYQIGGTVIVAVPLGGAGDPVGSDALLLGDTLVTHTAVENCLFFVGLQAGTYEVLTYAWMPTAPATRNRVSVDTHPFAKMVGGAWTGAHVEGVSFARHIVQVTAEGWLRSHSGVPSGGDYGIGAALNGTQIRRLQTAPPLFVERGELQWLASLGATSYDVVRGDLGTLRATNGDFSLATAECLANDAPETRLSHALAPETGEGSWFLIRGVGPGGPLTWDEPSGSQVGSRDAEIDGVVAACP